MIYIYINRKLSNIKQTNDHHIINEISNCEQLKIILRVLRKLRVMYFLSEI